MNRFVNKISGLGLILMLSLTPASFGVEAVKAPRAPKKVELPKDIVKWEESRYPIYIFKPKAFETAEVPQGILLLSGDSDKAILEWKAAADSAGMLLVSAEPQILDKDVSEKADEWVLNTARQLGLQNNVKNFYLVGSGNKAHYAAYLGLKYPAKFAGVASIGASWVGPFEQLIRYSENDKKQTIFFVAMQQNDPFLEATKARTEELREKGYSAELIILEKKGEEKSENLKADALMWLQARTHGAAKQQPALNVKPETQQPVSQKSTALKNAAQASNKVEEVKEVKGNVAASQPAAMTPSPIVKKSKWKTKASQVIEDFFAV